MSTALTMTRSTTSTSASTTSSSSGVSAASATARAALPRLRLGGALGPIAEDLSPSTKPAEGFEFPSPSISPTPPYGSRCKGVSASNAAAATDERYPAVAFKVDERFVPTAPSPKPFTGKLESRSPPVAARSSKTPSTETDEGAKAPASPSADAEEAGKVVDSPSLSPVKSYEPLHLTRRAPLD